MNIKIVASPNYSQKERQKKDIKFVIFHYTGMQSEIESIKRLKNSKFKVSCHYLINRKGKIIQMVKDKNVSWHAGKSKWKKFINLNNNSLGIELVNKGHQFGYQNFSIKQINSLIHLIMYSHYLVTSFGYINPLKKFVTMSQIGQFYSCIAHSVLVVLYENIVPKSYALLELIYHTSLIILFTNFYKKTYNINKLK